MKGWRHLLLLSLAAVSCSSPTYRSEVPLSNNFFESSDGALRGQIPQGWFAPSESDLPPHIAAWLVREDYSAMLFFQEIKVDQSTSQLIDRDGLTLLAEISFQLKQADEPSATLLNNPQEVSTDGKIFCRYEYRSGTQGQNTSVAVFRAMNRYFESTVLPTKPSPPSNYEQLMNTQQAVLFSMQY